MSQLLTFQHKEISVLQEDRMRLQHWLFLLFWMLKPFYFGRSGTMQISDYIFVLSFLVLIIDRRGLFELQRIHMLFFLYVLGTVIVNAAYTIMFKNQAFLLASSYYVYNSLMIISIADHQNNESFLKALLRATKMNILIQLIIFITNQGRFFYNSPRYMGTFNDPNQFAFSMFTSFLLIYTLTYHFRSKGENRSKAVLFPFYAITFYFIVQSSSNGMLLGIVAFTVFVTVYFIFSKKTRAFRLLQALFLALMALLVVYFVQVGVDVHQWNAQSFLIQRLLYKLNKVDARGIVALLEERGLDKLYNYPIYNILGAGDGLYNRFIDSVFQVEVHSTLPGALFYYGIVPFTLLIVWLVSMMRGTASVLIPVFLSMLVESFTLANQRQPIFWMIIVLCGLTAQSGMPSSEQGHGLRIHVRL